MSYLPLTLKYRPRLWSDLVGQDVTVKVLRTMIQDKKVHPVHVLAGPRGTGKTTTARILVAALNCEVASPDPCGKCQSCLDIQAGFSLALSEKDAASEGLVDDVRKLRQELVYANETAYKVYVLDECHAMSTAAWQAFLKILEEPPERVVFVFCTTEIDRVPETVLSRAFVYALSRVTEDAIKTRISWIATNERMELPEDVASAVATLARGGLRDAISLVDQFRTYSAGREPSLDLFQQMVGLASDQAVEAVSGAMLDGDVGVLMKSLQAVYARQTDVAGFVVRLVDIFNKMVLRRYGVIHGLPESLLAKAQTAEVSYLVDTQASLLKLLDTVKRSRLAGRTVVDAGLLTMLYRGPKGQDKLVTERPALTAMFAEMVTVANVPPNQPTPVQHAVAVSYLTAEQLASYLGARIL